MHDIRRLEAADTPIYRDIRLESLKNNPEAFGASLDDELRSTLDDMVDRLTRSSVFGAFDGEDLVGVAAWYCLGGQKTAHRGSLWGMYVRPRARGQGLGIALVRNILCDARNSVEQIHLTVAASNELARRLYERVGFVSYGIEPRVLRIDGDYLDEIMMVRMLD